ncbi:protamine-like protein [Scophthalmus maximus]|uniref:protamine-like protein n=1 Tax=Scophthalmus maximus TaxID=52904 RepID=UPI001FA82A5D|nr:protamine-like protein [Scophthalmus maximus]
MSAVLWLTLHGSHQGFINAEPVKRASRDITLQSLFLSEPHSSDPGTSAFTMSSAGKRAKSRRKRTGPTVSDLILKAMSVSTERVGVSLPGLKKALKAEGYDVAKNNARILTAIRRFLANKSLAQTTGTGASGSFQLNKKVPAPQKRKVAKKTKRTSAKKAAGVDTQAAKKSPKRRKKAKSPRSDKRTAAAKKPRSPSKTMRRFAKSYRTRAAAKK